MPKFLEWVFDARLMEQEVTRFFILFHTGTTLIDRPIDPFADSFAGLFCFCLVSLYTKKRHPTSGLSANRHIWLFDPNESRQHECKRFSSQLSFVLIRIRTRACRLFRLQKLLIHAAIDSRFFSVYTIILIPYRIYFDSHAYYFLEMMYRTH